jgi:hypothetical protein
MYLVYTWLAVDMLVGSWLSFEILVQEAKNFILTSKHIF